ncbi:UDP-glycosyltransferase 83A1 [Heracleum sosnowskyi]|uniref:UDP-glycosyltransferase 83A1 n=1 Tax=Heracleum sosnowskyi TaxID=360622 RepID=A0AAD8H417_9APIA|nr:UDP-glycosyltransferase 83A1 [Heracleum sosnowskyi]
MGNPHILAIPYPSQGHVIPLMELSLQLVKKGFKVTFVNTEFIHKRVLSALSKEDSVGELINLVSIPDGMEPWEDRSDLGKLCQDIFRVMPGELEKLVKDIKRTDDNEITCIIADENLGWALEVAEKMKIKKAAFWPGSAAVLALIFSIPNLIQDGILDSDGTILRHEMITLTSTMPAMNPKQFAWASLGNSNTERIIFNLLGETNRNVKLADRIICNTSYELEPAALALFPEILPIGPLLADHQLGKSSGYFWPADASCLAWLDQQPYQSVIYVAFGSITIFDQKQFEELALGLEVAKRPFLWVVRPDTMDEKSDMFLKVVMARIGKCGRTVGWTHQQAVLNHPSVGCFLSHCGWNSTMEGLSNGVPFLCWPYFADQFLNQTYICDVWKVGLSLDKDASGIITRGEIKNKVETLLNDKEFKERALIHQEKVTSGTQDNGYSDKNMSNFIEWMEM